LTSLPAIESDDLDLPGGGAFVFALDADDTSATGGVDGGPLGSLGVGPADLFVGVVAAGLGEVDAAGDQGESGRCGDHKLASGTHLRLASS